MKTALTFSLHVLVIIFFSISPAQAAIVTEHLTDPEFMELMSENAFAAEGRIGDLMGAATFELDIGPEHGNPTQTDQFDWPNGTPVPFTITYNSAMNLVSFIVGSKTLTYSPSPPYTDIFVRTRAVNDGSTMTVFDLVLDGEPISDTSGTSGPDGADTLWIKGGLLSDGYTLTGTALMNWNGTAPRHSRLAFQVKTSAVSPVSAKETTWGHIKALFE